MRRQALETRFQLHSNVDGFERKDEDERGFMSRVIACATRLIGTGLLLGILAAPMLAASSATASAETRSLKLYFVHTGEKAVITFKRNGVYDRQGLQQLNRFLRDWRRNQPTKMDPRLFDLIWEVYRRSGSRAYINVVCGFRSPETNSMLRSRTKGVADKSQHVLGKAMDYFIPDVKLSKLREIGVKLQVGGVGFYPHSGSPFVHMDVGNVRAWPRMSRQELVRLFPDGRTMHIPSDGKPLPGYQQAMADYKRRVGANHIEIADTGGVKKPGFFARLFGGGADEEEDNAPPETAIASAAPAPSKAKQQVLSSGGSQQPVLAAAGEDQQMAINAPIPLGRPASSGQIGNSGVAAALVEPQVESDSAAALAAAAAATVAADQDFPDLQAYDVPVPTLLGERPQNGLGTMEMAALDVPEQSAELADIPVPVSRPSGAEALLVTANGSEETAGDEAEQTALSPALATALDRSGRYAATPAAQADENAVDISAADTDEAYSTDEAESEENVAVLDGHTDAGAPDFAAIFDQQQDTSAPVTVPTSAAPIAKGQPVKAGRPTSRDAEIAAETMGKALTGEMLARWAVGNAISSTMQGKVKAPRFVSLAMRAQPVAPVTGGFSKAADIDLGRFN